MSAQIESPKIFTYYDIVAQLHEVFEGLLSATFLKPDQKELFELLADIDWLNDYLSNTIEEHIPTVLEELTKVVDDEKADEAITSYYKLFRQLYDAYHNYYELTLIHPDSLEDYVRPLFEGSEQVQNISKHVDWSAITAEYAENAEYIELNYPNINFVGKWIVK